MHFTSKSKVVRNPFLWKLFFLANFRHLITVQIEKQRVLFFFHVSHFELFDFKMLLEKENQIQMKEIKWNSKFTREKKTLCSFLFVCFIFIALLLWCFRVESLIVGAFHRTRYSQLFPFEKTTFSSVECYIYSGNRLLCASFGALFLCWCWFSCFEHCHIDWKRHAALRPCVRPH